MPQRFIDELFVEVSRASGDILPVELTAPEQEIERRLCSASRRQHGKLVDLALYRQLRAAGVFTAPRIPSPRLRLDTTAFSPEAAAREITRLAGNQGTKY